MNQQEQSIARFYQSSVPWVIDERDMKIINHYHCQERYNTETRKMERYPKSFIVNKLWQNSTK